MTNTATRLITLILLLQNRSNQKGSDLAAELGVSLRTLHRYVAMIEEMGIPVYTERGPYGGFSLLRGYKLPPLLFTGGEAVALALGAGLVEEIWGPLYREEARGALAKLDNVLPDEQRDEVAWARRSLVATGLHRTGMEAQAASLESLRLAIRETHPVNLLYNSASGSHPGRRTVDPYALGFRAGWWYLAGYCHTRQELRAFRVDRIVELESTEATFERPAEFDARKFLERDFRDQPQVRARLRFKPEAAQIVRSQGAYFEALEPRPDGALEATFSAPDLSWAASSILMYGPLVEVLEPAGLRDLVSQWAQATARLYT
jgi:predicted DNA-binding transcriptional regulator YafY